MGSKPGIFMQAGHCFVGSATRGGWRLVAVALNSGNCREDVESLLNYGLRGFRADAGRAQGRPGGHGGHPQRGAAGQGQVRRTTCSWSRLARQPLPAYTVKLTPLPLLPQAPIAAGTRLGTFSILVDGKVQATGDALCGGERRRQARRGACPDDEDDRADGCSKVIGALAACGRVFLGGWIVYARTAAKSARRRRDRLAAGVRGVDRPGPGPR